MNLLDDYVDFVICLRNKWLTEKCSELEFQFEDIVQTAKCSCLKLLHNAEADEIVKLPKLDNVAFFPKPIERQKALTCLKVSCDKTTATLEYHSKLDGVNVSGTAYFTNFF